MSSSLTSCTIYGLLAQLVERQTEDLRVPGSIPGESTIYGRMPESGQKGQTVNLLAMPALVQIQLLPPDKKHVRMYTDVLRFR